MNGWSCWPKHGPAHFTVLKTLLIWMVWNVSKSFKLMVGPCSPKHGPVPFRVLKNHFVWMLCRQKKKHSSLWLGRAPQHPLSRPSSFRGVEESLRFDVVQTFTNVQMNGWSCSSNHGPALNFTVLKTRFIWMVWSFSKTFELMAGPCSFQHGPVLLTWLKKRFVSMLCSRLETFKFMAGPRSATSLVTAQLISRRWKIISFWCYADFQQRSNERMVVLPQTRPSSFCGFEKPFRLDVMQPFRNIQVYGWAAFPNVLVTAQLISRRWKIISFWCYADKQQRSNERLVVLP